MRSRSVKSIVGEIEESGSVWDFIRDKGIRLEDVRITIDGTGEITRVCLQYTGATVCIDDDGILIARGSNIESIDAPGFLDRYVREKWYNLCIGSCIQNSMS